MSFLLQYKKPLHCLIFLIVVCILPITQLFAATTEAFHQNALQKLKEPWTGDLDGMVSRRVIRALVTFNKTNFFLDGGTTRGVTYEALTYFEKELNKKFKRRHLKIHIIFILVARDQLFQYLTKGLGDIAAANLTVTPERLKQVDFADPLYSQARELVVTSPSAPAINNLTDLSGKTVYVRKSSSYYQSLKDLNRTLIKAGRPQVRIEPANEYLETEDILEMVNADLVQITVADNYLAEFWAQVFDNITVHKNIALRSGGKIAWAVRKNCPKLKKAINEFVKRTKKGTLLGNILFKRYLQDTKWLRNSLAPEDIERFNNTIKYFKRYAGKYGFDWLIITALAYQESGLDQSKRSPAGAIGVMQLLPSTAAGKPVSITDIHLLEKNVHAGVKYLHHIYDRYYKNADMDQLDKILFTFASYNAGPAKVASLRRRAKSMGLNPNKWFRNVEVAAARVIGRETVQYVSNIFKYYTAYKQIIVRIDKKKESK